MNHIRVEKPLDINLVLMRVYASLESVCEEMGVELIYDIDSTVPKELKGDADALSHLLTHVLRFVIRNSDRPYAVLSISAPKEFIYMEEIEFRVDTSASNISVLKARSFFESRLNALLERVEGRAEFDEEHAYMALHIPFKLKELGNRRYYRLPDIRMLGKKVLLICQNPVLSQSVAKMFRYFLYEVDEGADAYKERGSNIAYYDIFVLERELINDGIVRMVEQVKQQHDLKFVILDEPNYLIRKAFEQGIVSAYLVKPVMQASVFDLIVSLYEEESATKQVHETRGKVVVDIGNYLQQQDASAHISDMSPKENGAASTEKNDVSQVLPGSHVLNRDTGEKIAMRMGDEYPSLLQSFLDKFGESDRYFEGIVQGRAEWQLKEFLKDLEKDASLIGAEKLAQFAQMAHRLYIYKQWEKSDIFIKGYRYELGRVKEEIERVLA